MKKILSLALVLAMLLCAFASCGKKEVSELDENGMYNYSEIDFSKYISLSRDSYYGKTVKVDVTPEIDDDDVEEFLDYLCQQETTFDNYTDKPIEKGDIVHIYFRGTADGKDFEGGSNMTTSTPTDLEIGSGQFIPSFEDALIGIVPNTTSFTKISSGSIKADYIVYATYSYSYNDGAEKKEGSVTTPERIDLSSPAGYDSAFAANFVDKTIGATFTFTADVDIDGDGDKDSVTYDMKVANASIEQTAEVKVKFPDPYPKNEELAGKEATFYVVIESLERPNVPELTEALIKKLQAEMGFTSEKTGDEYISEFRAFVKGELSTAREDKAKNEALNLLVDEMMKTVEVKSYPEIAVNEITKYYDDELKSYFDYYGASYGCETIEDFIPLMYKIPEGQTYDEWKLEQAQAEVRYNMIVNYIMDEEKISFTDEELKEAVDKLAQDYSAYYSSYYGQTITKDDVYAEFGEDALAEECHYNKVFEFLADNIVVEMNIVEESAEAGAQ